eukprot:gene20715-22748_t
MNPTIRELLQNINRLGQELGDGGGQQETVLNAVNENMHPLSTTAAGAGPGCHGPKPMMPIQAQNVQAGNSVETELSQCFRRNLVTSSSTAVASRQLNAGPRFRMAYNFMRSSAVLLIKDQIIDLEPANSLPRTSQTVVLLLKMLFFLLALMKV